MAKSSRTQQPITRHPLFPAIVALWFGALFGLGSLAIRASLLEAAVVATGIDLLVPVAAPPLGVTARILLALVMALIGGLVGVTLGLRMGRVKAEAPQRRRTSLAAQEPDLPRRADAFSYAEPDEPRRPLSAFDELPDNEQIDSDPIEEPAPMRRRQLAMEEPTRPDYARAFAPLPGGELEAAPLDLLELAEPLEDAGYEPASWAPDEPVIELESQPAAAEPELAAAAPRQFDAAPISLEPAPAPAMMRRFDALGSEPVQDSAPEIELDDRDLPPRNLGQRLERPAAIPEPMVASAPPAEREPAQAAVPPGLQPTSFSPGSGTAAEQLRAAPLEGLSHIQLIERLALSMEQRRLAVLVQAASQIATPAGVFSPAAFEAPRFGFEPKEPIDLPELALAPFSPPVPVVPATLRPVPLDLAEPAEADEPTFAPPRMPAAMRPIGLDFEEDSDDEPSLAPPRFAFAAPPAAPVAPVPLASAPQPDEFDAEDAADESYSSLLGLGRAPLRQPLIRIEEAADQLDEIEPVVIFPGHGSRPFASPAPVATEAVAPEPAPVQPGLRRFDAPSADAQQAAPASGQIDPEETERALRSALATLQRMSGAA